MVQIEQIFLKRKFFLFLNYWVEQPGFYDIVISVWDTEVRATNSATRIAAKFKLLRSVETLG
jgi:hypothetical protein